MNKLCLNINNFRKIIQKILKCLKSQGFIKTFDLLIFRLLKSLREKLYKWSNFDYGIKEVLFWPTSIDIWLRYSVILKNIPSGNGEIISILDVGSGGPGIAEFIRYKGESEKYEVTLLDISESKLKKVRLAPPIVNTVVGDAHELPFPNNTFDVVVAVDSFEHIPEATRGVCYSEIKRVAKRCILLHLPLQDVDHKFHGETSDIKFQTAHQKEFGCKEFNAAEHIEAGHPTLDEITENFPGAEFTGTQNTNIWLKYMILQRKPILRYTTGILYFLRWKKKDNKPPFHSCLVKVSDTNGKST